MRIRSLVMMAGLLLAAAPIPAAAQAQPTATTRLSTVAGTVFGGSEAFVAVRARPEKGAKDGPYIQGGTRVEVECYVDGGSNVSGWFHPSNPYWDKVAVYGPGSSPGKPFARGWMADVWVNTNGDITKQSQPCWGTGG
ncbi:hypothetical protein [Streptosporangium sp. NPDC020145]|uniref:hypothetical protein n=1 Tax=Streptosporangium sp. NPDC020145 TaxID=3154694 RepID=UPI00341B38C1